MTLFYYRGRHFGDDLNPWIWGALAPELLDDTHDALFLGIGTLINSNVPAAPKRIVFGTRVGCMEPALIDHRWQFYCARGPHSAQSLGLDKSLAITDPAVLLTQIVDEPFVSHNKICYMPHHASLLRANWAEISEKAGLVFLDPTAGAKATVQTIRGARLVLSAAMHGAIVADAFRVPWTPIVAYGHILGFKWEDWCQSLGMPYQPRTIASLWDTDRNRPLSHRAKDTLNHGLKKAGIWSHNWTLPVPGPDMRCLEGTVITQLTHLANGDHAFFSDDRYHHGTLERHLEKLERLRKDASASIGVPAFGRAGLLPHERPQKFHR